MRERVQETQTVYRKEIMGTLFKMKQDLLQRTTDE